MARVRLKVQQATNWLQRPFPGPGPAPTLAWADGCIECTGLPGGLKMSLAFFKRAYSQQIEYYPPNWIIIPCPWKQYVDLVHDLVTHRQKGTYIECDSSVQYRWKIIVP